MEVIFIKGLILAVENVPKEKATIMKIKDFFRQYGDVAYVTYEDGEDKAEIRFNGEENGATRAWEAAVKGGEENKVMFEGQEITGRTLDGEEEKAYWTKFNEKKMEKFNRKGGRGGRGGGFSKRGGRQQHHKGYKRPNEGNGNEGPDKKAKKTVFNDEEQ
ncbi:hypothetical protein AB6A40_010312 [Gnathostoma spinigerum]|uniref:XRRM domain-containing protein n=1 Tax=Gnathostoma spinigerum TaxID=75299 RepID=A0ABD6EUH7_9BILA